MDEATPSYPGDAPLALRQVKQSARDGYCLYQLTTSLHTGTHVDVPMHLTDDPRFVCEWPLTAFAGPAVLLDVRGQARLDMYPAYAEAVREGDIVLLHTGWDAQYACPARYFGEHPEMADALTDFLLARRIRMLGLDMPSPDRPPFAAHRRLLAAGIPIVENMTNLAALPREGRFDVQALPLRLRAEASPVRAVAWVDG